MCDLYSSADKYISAGIVKQFECELLTANIIGKLLMERGEDTEIIPAGFDKTFRESLMFNGVNAAIYFSTRLRKVPLDYTTGIALIPHNNDNIRRYSKVLELRMKEDKIKNKKAIKK